MRIIKDKKYRKFLILISIPILIIAQYYFFKVGILRPMVKGAEIKIAEGDYILDIDQFVMKLNDKVTLSSGEYITIPSYAKDPNIWFNVLDNSGVLKIENKNELVAMKEGTSAVAIMKNSRVLRKANVKVVDPKVKDIIVKSDNDLKYVGDVANINTTLKVDYEKFEKKEKVTYKSSDESVIKIVDNKVEAIGVGSAKVYIKAKNKEEVLEYNNIKAKVAKIDIETNVKIEVDESKKLDPKITTSPEGLKHPKVKYELVENKLSIQRAIRLDPDGTIVGIRNGSEKVRVICDNKSKIITVEVVEKSLTNNKIENLNVDYNVIDNKLQVSLTWDYIEGIFDYDVYLRNNSLQESKFKVVKSVNIKEKDVKSSKKVKTTIEVDLIDGKIPSLSMYVVGKTQSGLNTDPSNIVNIGPPKENIGDIAVENLQAYINEESNTAKLNWNAIPMKDIQYSIYVKNNLAQDSGFTLLESSVSANEYTINLEDGDVDLDVYVKAKQGDKYSKDSNIIKIKREKVTEENNPET